MGTLAASHVISLPMRRFPPPWTVEKIAGGFKVCDANGTVALRMSIHARTGMTPHGQGAYPV